MPTTITVGSGKSGVSSNIEVQTIHIALAVAALFVGYEIASKYDIPQKAEALVYGYPANRAQAAQDMKKLQSLLAYAQKVGDVSLQSEVQARITAITNTYGSAATSTVGTSATTVGTSGTASTSGATSTSGTSGSAPASGTSGTASTSSTSSAPPAGAVGSVPSSSSLALAAAQTTGVPVPSTSNQANIALQQLDAIWWVNPGTSLQSAAHLEATYVRSKFPNSGPSGGYTYTQIRKIYPSLPLRPPKSPLGASIILGMATGAGYTA